MWREKGVSEVIDFSVEGIKEMTQTSSHWRASHGHFCETKAHESNGITLQNTL